MAQSNLDATDIIKPFVPEIEEAQQEEKGPTPFDFIKAVSNTKTDIISENPELEKHYNAYIVNRGFGYFLDTVLHANQLNLYPDMPKKAQYYYYMYALRKHNRFSKWHKLEKNPDLELVQKIYNVRAEVAKEYLKILKNSDLEKLRKLTETGENSSKINKKVK